MNRSIPHAMNGYPAHNVASSSSTPYPEFNPMPPSQSQFPPGGPPGPLTQHHRQSQHMGEHRATPPGQWPPAMLQNQSQHQQQHQQNPHQQQFNPSWQNQMQQTPFPPGMPMHPFNMPFLQQQVLHDAFAMSAPVEAADEMTLVTALLSSKRKGETYKDALNSLHGKNGHSASLWKDYYLDHKDHLDNWVASYAHRDTNTPPVSAHPSDKGHARSHVQQLKDSARPFMGTIKKPSPASFKQEPSPAPSSISAPIRKHSSKQSTPTIPAAGSRRSTINSLTAPAPVYGDRLPPPNAEIKIPDPPSRSPSPPTRVIPQGRGNKYTQEDRDFFIKFISWRLKGDPDLSRLDLCAMLSKKAPHHTAQSWASHWSNNHDVPDKILAAARGDEYISEEEEEAASDTSEEKIPTPRRRPVYRDSSTEPEQEESDEEHHKSDDEDDDDVPLKHWKESEMGAKGEPFNDADHYITAKYIASFPNWNNLTAKEKWEPFSKKHSQRSAKSWAEYYRRSEKVIQKIVRKILKEQTGSTGLSDAQCMGPSLIPPKAKRKLNFDDDESSDNDRSKRGRGAE